MKRSLILTSTDAALKKKQKTFTDVNPAAQGSAMQSMLQQINALTTNTYVESNCIDKYNLDDETPPIVITDTRLDPTFSITNESFLTGMSTGGKSSTYTTNSDGEISIAINGNHGILAGLVTNNNIAYLNTSLTGSTQSAGTLTIRISGTATYKPFEQIYTFT